ncbi:MAG TPA: MarR family winged helix-turn-helix transcriptional regulator [Cellulomonas sp.]
MTARQGSAPDGAGTALAPTAVDEDTVWRAYLGMTREMFTALERGLGAEAGVSVADLELMEPLASAGERGLRAKDLASAAEWQDSRVSHQLRRMERRGLVVRTRDRQDARGTMVRLTSDGLRSARAATATRRRLVAELLVGAMRPEQVVAFVELAGQTRQRLSVHAEQQAGTGTEPPVVTASEVRRG